MGWDMLVATSTDDQGQGVLSRAAFNKAWDSVATRIGNHASKGTATGRSCDIPVGLTATKLTPVREAVSKEGTLKASIQRTVGVFRAVTDSSTNSFAFIEPDSALISEPSLGRAMMLPPNSTEPGRILSSPYAPREVRERDLYKLVTASAAFPFAFGPVELALYPRSCARERGDCTVETQFYADGGVFDNQAISAALALERAANPGYTARQLAERQRLLITMMAECKITDEQQKLLDQISDMTEKLGDANELEAAVKSVVEAPDSVTRIDQINKLNRLQMVRKNRSIAARIMLLQFRVSGTCSDLSIDSITDLIQRNSNTRKIHAVFVDAGVLRGPMLRFTEGTPIAKELLPSPMRAAAQLVGNAVGPATQYELAVLGRALDENGDTLLTSTSRSLPLMADGFAHFGAFFGEIFRRHDFYVGVYDGLRNMVREYPCAGPDRASCIDRTVQQILVSEVFNLGCDAHLLIARLYSLEIGATPQRTAEIDSTWLPYRCRAKGVDSTVEFKRGIVLRALASAAFTAGRRSIAMETTCTGIKRSVLDVPLCKSLLFETVSEWKIQLAVAGIALPKNECNDLRRNVQVGAFGRLDSKFCEMLEDPYTMFHSSVATLLQRTQEKEKGIVGLAVDLAAYAERANFAAYRAGFQVGNPAIGPVTASDPMQIAQQVVLRSIAPFSLDLIPQREIILGWLPLGFAPRLFSHSLLRVQTRVSARIPLEIPYENRPKQLFFPSVGVQWVPPGKLLQSVATYVSDAGKDGQRYEATVSAIAGTVRLGVRWEPHRKYTIVLGVGDVSNLLMRGVKTLFQGD